MTHLFDPDTTDINAPLADPCAGKHGGAPTSVAAWDAAKLTAGQRRQQILAWLHGRGAGGGTADEFAAEFDLTPNSISGRFSELAKQHLIRRATSSGKPVTRPARSGTAAQVWVGNR